MRFLSFLFVLMFMGFCNAQNPQISKTYSLYYLGQECISSLSYTITNIEDNPLYLWMTKEIAPIDDSLKVRNYFKLPKGDTGSLYQMMLDGNVVVLGSFLFNSFIKILNPKDTFTFVFTSKDMIFDDSMNTIIDSRLVILPENIILKQCPGLTIKESPMINQFLYKQNLISIIWEDFVSQLGCASSTEILLSDIHYVETPPIFKGGR